MLENFFYNLSILEESVSVTEIQSTEANNNNNNNNVWPILRPVPVTYASENVILRYDVVLVGI